MNARKIGLMLPVVLALAPLPGMAWKLKPWATDGENKVRYLEAGAVTSWLDKRAARIVDHFSNPVHEEITQRIFGCESPAETSCLASSSAVGRVPFAVTFGVQWNDNPPFQVAGIPGCPENTTIRLPNYSKCWVMLFNDAEKKAQDEYFDFDTQHAMLYRVHFGDMQFLHSMASWNGETSRDTKAKIMGWAELTYRTAIGELRPTSLLNASEIPEMKHVFLKKGWTIEGLFSLGQEPRLKAAIPDIAFGSLLHMVQDSFAKGHVSRDEATVGQCTAAPALRKAGDILEFHSYEGQNKASHGDADAAAKMQAHLLASDPNVVALGRALLDMRARGVPWGEARKYLDECVFPLTSEMERHPAGPGADFRN